MSKDKKLKYKGKPSEILEPIEFEGVTIKTLKHGNTDQILFRYPRKEDGEPCWTTDDPYCDLITLKKHFKIVHVIKLSSVKTDLSNTLMDDLAWSIYEYLLDESTDFQGKHIVLLPITVIARKFDRNHRTVSRRLSALRDEGLIKTIIKKDYVALYHINDHEEND